MGIYNVLRPFKRRIYAEPETKRTLLEHLMNLFKIYSPSGQENRVADYCMEVLSRFNFSCERDKMGNVLARRGVPPVGGKYICLNAHMDTVQGERDRIVEDQGVVEYHQYEDIISTHGQAVLGGDDKAGCAIILTLAQTTNLPFKILLTVQEESGGGGAREVSKDFYNDVLFVFTMDRRGAADIIINYCGSPCAPETIVAAVNNSADANAGERFFVAHGSFADTHTISKNVPAVNLSCGYYNPHSANEIVDVEAVHRTLLTVKGSVENGDSIKAALDAAPANWNKPVYRYDAWDDWGYGRVAYGFGGGVWREPYHQRVKGCGTGLDYGKGRTRQTKWEKNRFNQMAAGTLIETYLELSEKMELPRPPWSVEDDYKLAKAKVEYLLSQYESGARYADGIDLEEFAQMAYTEEIIDADEYEYKRQMRINMLENLALGGTLIDYGESAEELDKKKKSKKKKKKKEKEKLEEVVSDNDDRVYAALTNPETDSSIFFEYLSQIKTDVENGVRFGSFILISPDGRRESIRANNVTLLNWFYVRGGEISKDEFDQIMGGYNENVRKSQKDEKERISKARDLLIEDAVDDWVDENFGDDAIKNEEGIARVLELYASGFQTIEDIPIGRILNEMVDRGIIIREEIRNAKKLRKSVSVTEEEAVAGKLAQVGKRDRKDYIDVILNTAIDGVDTVSFTLSGVKYAHLNPLELIRALVSRGAILDSFQKSEAEDLLYSQEYTDMSKAFRDRGTGEKTEKKKDKTSPRYSDENEFASEIKTISSYSKSIYIDPIVEKFSNGKDMAEATVLGKTYRLNLERLMLILQTRGIITSARYNTAVRRRKESGRYSTAQTQITPRVVHYGKGRSFSPRNNEVYRLLDDYAHGKINWRRLHDAWLDGHITLTEHDIAQDWRKEVERSESKGSPASHKKKESGAAEPIVWEYDGFSFRASGSNAHDYIIKYAVNGDISVRELRELVSAGEISEEDYIDAIAFRKAIESREQREFEKRKGLAGDFSIDRTDSSEEIEEPDYKVTKKTKLPAMKTQALEGAPPSQSVSSPLALDIIRRYTIGELDNIGLNLALDLGEITANDMRLAYDWRRKRENALGRTMGA